MSFSVPAPYSLCGIWGSSVFCLNDCLFTGYVYATKIVCPQILEYPTSGSFFICGQMMYCEKSYLWGILRKKVILSLRKKLDL